jgi:homospermidine synthase
VRFEQVALTPGNYREVLKPIVADGYLVNLSVDVSSAALIQLCREIDALYIDTCIEPWAGGYLDNDKPLSMRTNYALREEVRSIRGEGPTALIAHGANPGMVSHLYKRALVRLAADMGHTVAPVVARASGPSSRAGSASRACTSPSATRSGPTCPSASTSSSTRGRSKASSPRACSRRSSAGARTRSTCRPRRRSTTTAAARAIFLTRPGATTRVRSWTPNAGPIQGYLITHNESISIADYLTIEENGEASVPARPCTTPTTRATTRS